MLERAQMAAGARAERDRSERMKDEALFLNSGARSGVQTAQPAGVRWSMSAT